MRISALDIRQQQFTARMRGFDRQEVEAFLDDVAEDYESVVKENALLKEQLATLEERSRNITEHERTLQDTLVTTHRLTEEMKQAAKRECDMLVRDAEMRADKMVEALRTEEARLKQDLAALRRTRAQLIEELRGTLARYDRLLQSEAKGDGGVGITIDGRRGHADAQRVALPRYHLVTRRTGLDAQAQARFGRRHDALSPGGGSVASSRS